MTSHLAPTDWVPPTDELPAPFPYVLSPDGRLGGGRFGVVFEALDRRLLAPGGLADVIPVVAIKFLLGSEATQDALHEAGRYRDVRHQNLVRMIDFLDLRGHSGWPPYALVLERCDSSLDWVLNRVRETKTPLSQSAVVRYAGQLALIINALHRSHGLVHRDIKPGNLFFKLAPRQDRYEIESYKDADLLLGDLGTADKDGQEAAFILGRDFWKPPELSATAKQHPAFSEDIYAFGKVLLDLADGVDNGGSFPNRLRDVARACTVANPTNRPSADELLDLLGEADVMPGRLISVAEKVRNYRIDQVPEIGMAAACDRDLVNAYASVSKGRVEVIRGILTEAKAVWRSANPIQFVDFPPSEVFAHGVPDTVNWQSAFCTAGTYSGQLLAALLLVQDDGEFTQEARSARARVLGCLYPESPKPVG